MPATPCPGSPGCRCAYCFGAREYMVDLTGKDYGLPVTYKPWRVEAPVPEVLQFRPRERVRQPWEVRPARKRAA